MAQRNDLQSPLLPIVNPSTSALTTDKISALQRTLSSGRKQSKDSPRLNNRTGSGQVVRQKDKLVPLPDSNREYDPPHDLSDPPSLRITKTLSDVDALPPDVLTPELHTASTTIPFPLHFDPLTETVEIVCVADTFEHQVLRQIFATKLPEFTLRMYQDVLYAWCDVDGREVESRGLYSRKRHVFLFEYGVLVFWGFPKEEQQRLLNGLRSSTDIQLLPDGQVETDQFQVVYAAREKGNIQNDVITISTTQWSSTQVKLAISHALAQSTKLAVYEERVMDVIERSRHLPEQLASQGRVKLGRTELAKLIGSVYLQRTEVNLLSSVLDTPEFLWESPDSLDVLYKRMLEYLEIEDRVEAINNRFMVLSEMLDLLRDQQANLHGTRLELIVIWLIVISVVIGLLEVVGLFSFKAEHSSGPANKLTRFVSARWGHK